MKILFYPEPDGANEYTSNMVANLEAVAGEPVHFSPNIKAIVLRPFKTFCFKKYDVAVINWLENNLRSEGDKLFAFGVLKFFVYILFFKLAATKTVYVRHNVYPHDIPSRQSKTARKIIDFAERLFDKKVSHSGHLVDEGYFYVPHPLYDTHTGLLTAKADDRQDYYLVFGRIARYKQLHKLIDNWPQSEKLLIAGPASDSAYVEELKTRAQGLDIEFDIRFLPNQDVDAIMSHASAIILSHAGDEMIVSGSFFHAISYGLPVIASEQAFLCWLKQDMQFSGLTLFSSMEALAALLKAPITTSKQAVLNESDRLFGEQVVQASLTSLLNELNRGIKLEEELR